MKSGKRPIIACMRCLGMELKPVYRMESSFSGAYYCPRCKQTVPALTFEDLESYLEFRKTREL